jgi:hypothetical protein
MPQMQRAPGRHVTRRIEQPRNLPIAKQQPGPTAVALAESHNTAVRTHGSNSGGRHAFDPTTRQSAGVWDGYDGFPRNTVITPLSWGRIDAKTAQRVLEGDGFVEEPS